MRMKYVPRFLLVACLSFASSVPAAEEPDIVPPANRPDPAALRERARNANPGERQRLMREFREQHGLTGTNRSDWEKRREELRKLPPAERDAKLKALRQEIQEGRGRFKLLSTDERETKRDELKARIDGQISELHKRKAEAALSDPEQRRLTRMEQMSGRLSRVATNQNTAPVAPKR